MSKKKRLSKKHIENISKGRKGLRYKSIQKPTLDGHLVKGFRRGGKIGAAYGALVGGTYGGLIGGPVGVIPGASIGALNGGISGGLYGGTTGLGIYAYRKNRQDSKRRQRKYR